MTLLRPIVVEAARVASGASLVLKALPPVSAIAKSFVETVLVMPRRHPVNDSRTDAAKPSSSKGETDHPQRPTVILKNPTAPIAPGLRNDTEPV